MAGLGDSIGLLFKIKADASQSKEELDKAEKDFKKFTRDVKDESDKIGDSGSFNKFAQSIGLSAEQTAKLSAAMPIAGAAIAGVAAGLAATVTAAVALTSALYDVSSQVAATAKEIDNFNKMTGFSTDTIQALKIASEEAGLSLEQTEEVFESFVELMNEAGTGAEDATKKVKALGLDPQTAYKDLEGSFLKILDKIRETTSQAGKLQVAQIGLGESGSAYVKVAENMTGGTKAYIQTQKEAGRVMSAEGIGKAKEFSKAQKELERDLTSVKNTIALEVMPVFVDAMRQVSKFFRENKEDVKLWGVFLKGVISDVLYVATTLLKVLTSINKAFAEAAKSAREAEKNPRSISTGNSLSTGRFGSSEQAQAVDNKGYVPQPVIKPPEPAGVRGEGNVNEKPDKSDLLDIGKGDKKSSNKNTVEQEMRKTFEELGFKVVRTFGKAINEGSLHPKGLAVDLSVKNKNVEDLFQAAIVGINKGWQLVDERVPRVGKDGKPIKQTGPHFHFEKDSGKDPSLFLGAEYYGGQAQLDYLKKLDQARLDKRGGVDGFKQDLEDQRQKAIKNREEQDAAILQIARNTSTEEKAITEQDLANKILSQEAYRKLLAASDLGYLEIEKAVLEQRLKMTELNAEERAKIEKEIAGVTSQIKVKQIEAETDGIKDANEALEKQKQILNDIYEIREQVIKSERGRNQTNYESYRGELDERLGKAKNNPARKAILKEIEQLELDYAKRQKDYTDEDIKREKDAAIEKLTDKEIELGRKADLERLYDNLSLEAKEQYEARKKEIENKHKDPEKRTFGSAFEDFKNQLIDDESIQDASGTITEFGNLAVNSLQNMTNAVGNAIASWALYGESVGKALKKAMAAELAHIAGVATIKALYATALGFIRLAELNFPAATNAFISAGLWAALAGGSALAAKALSGGSQSSSNAVSNTASGNTASSVRNSVASNDERTFNEPRLRSSESSDIKVLELRLPKEMVSQAFVEDFNNLGESRRVIIKLMDES